MIFTALNQPNQAAPLLDLNWEAYWVGNVPFQQDKLPSSKEELASMILAASQANISCSLVIEPKEPASLVDGILLQPLDCVAIVAIKQVLVRDDKYTADISLDAESVGYFFARRLGLTTTKADTFFVAFYSACLRVGMVAEEAKKLMMTLRVALTNLTPRPELVKKLPPTLKKPFMELLSGFLVNHAGITSNGKFTVDDYCEQYQFTENEWLSRDTMECWNPYVTKTLPIPAWLVNYKPKATN